MCPRARIPFPLMSILRGALAWLVSLVLIPLLFPF